MAIMSAIASEPSFPDRPEAALWRTEVAKALKGAPFESLVAHTLDGIPIAPLYDAADTVPLGSAERRPGAWRVFERIDHPDGAAAAAAAEAAIEGGADGIALVLEGAASARGFGVPAEALANLRRPMLRGKCLIRIDPGSAGEAAAAGLAAAAAEDEAALSVALDFDPLGAAFAAGRPIPEPGAIVATAKALCARGLAGPLFATDGRVWHEAGAGEADELGAVLAGALAAWRALEAAGLPTDAARRRLSFVLAADADLFLTVAKLRALRRLWARIETAAGLSPAPIALHVETAWRMATRQDAWNDMVRGTVAVFGAAAGGADSIAVLPFTAALGLAEDGARRLARTTQLVLLHEAKLARTVDPVAGAGGFEALTSAVETAGAAALRRIEAEGGLAASLASGKLAARFAQTAAARAAAVAEGRMAIIGVTAHPPAADEPPSVTAGLSPAKYRPDGRVAAAFETGRGGPAR